jgi:hypothetical protein
MPADYFTYNIERDPAVQQLMEEYLRRERELNAREQTVAEHNRLQAEQEALYAHVLQRSRDLQHERDLATAQARNISLEAAERWAAGFQRQREAARSRPLGAPAPNYERQYQNVNGEWRVTQERIVPDVTSRPSVTEWRLNEQSAREAADNSFDALVRRYLEPTARPRPARPQPVDESSAARPASARNVRNAAREVPEGVVERMCVDGPRVGIKVRLRAGVGHWEWVERLTVPRSVFGMDEQVARIVHLYRVDGPWLRYDMDGSSVPSVPIT